MKCNLSLVLAIGVAIAMPPQASNAQRAAAENKAGEKTPIEVDFSPLASAPARLDYSLTYTFYTQHLKGLTGSGFYGGKTASEVRNKFKEALEMWGFEMYPAGEYKLVVVGHQGSPMEIVEISMEVFGPKPAKDLTPTVRLAKDWERLLK
jgi:hypothetical protein